MPTMPLTLVIDNVRSAYNVGSLWRTADSVGAERLILTGISPHPTFANDQRLPHVSKAATRQIAKTALGAENAVPFEYHASVTSAIDLLRTQGYYIYALEQTPKSIPLFKFIPHYPMALIVGHETLGINPLTTSRTDGAIEITQYGHKESLNVSVAGAIAMYFIRYSFNIKA